MEGSIRKKCKIKFYIIYIIYNIYNIILFLGKDKVSKYGVTPVTRDASGIIKRKTIDEFISERDGNVGNDVGNKAYH